MQRFVEKEKLLSHFNEHGVFPGSTQKYKDLTTRFCAIWMFWASLFSGLMGWAFGSTTVCCTLTLFLLHVCALVSNACPSPSLVWLCRCCSVAWRWPRTPSFRPSSSGPRSLGLPFFSPSLFCSCFFFFCSIPVLFVFDFFPLVPRGAARLPPGAKRAQAQS